MFIGIIADDLTGAADAVAPFAARGLAAFVDLRAGIGQQSPIQYVGACAWTTENRDAPGRSEAMRRHLASAACRIAVGMGARLIYIKIDSTLRGFPLLDLTSVRAELPPRIALVCPAFPAAGRTVRNGLLHVHGEPLHDLHAAFDGRSVAGAAEIRLDDLRRGRCLDAGWVAGLQAAEIHTVFADAETDSDMDILARAVLADLDFMLPVGSAGLSAAIARQAFPDALAGGQIWTSTVEMSHASDGTPTIFTPPENGIRPSSGIEPVPDDSGALAAVPRNAATVLKPFHVRPVLVTVGSRNPVSRSQALVFAQTAGIEPIVLQPLDSSARALRQILEAFETGSRTVLLVSPDEHTYPGVVGALHAPTPFLPELVRAVPDICLLMTGGETAMAMLADIPECAGLEIVGEAEPGVAVARIRGIEPADSQVDGIPLIIKAGGFGDERLIARCLGIM